MSVIINPGSGPVADASREQADLCIQRFIEDLELGDVQARFVKECRGSAGPDGRYEYVLALGERSTEVEMPGLPVERVRYLGGDEQNIWDFPRLYVDGGSWVWRFGLGVARRTLTGEDEARAFVPGRRSGRLPARVSWALLPYIGLHCERGSGRWRWYMPVAFRLWKLVGLLPGSDLYPPLPPIVCRCDECLALEAAVTTGDCVSGRHPSTSSSVAGSVVEQEQP